METLGVEQIYVDKMSGKNSERPQLKEIMSYVRRGDMVVGSISRFARNTRDLQELVEQLTAKGVEFVSQKEAIGTATPTGKFMLTMFGAVDELEREYILQRQREGSEISKAQGKYTSRKPVSSPDFDKVADQWLRGMSKARFYCKVGR